MYADPLAEEFLQRLDRRAWAYHNIIGQDVTEAWTPTLTFATPGDLAVVYSARLGIILRVGRMIHVLFRVVTSTFTHTTAAGACSLTGLPLTSWNVTGLTPRGALQWQGITKANYTDIVCGVEENTSAVRILASGSGQASDSVNAADMPTTGTVGLVGQLVYLVERGA